MLVVAAIALGCYAHVRRRAQQSMPPSAWRPTSGGSWVAAARVFEQRCLVCHGRNDAPCQLELDTYEGVARGGTEHRVHDGMRLLAAAPTRLGIDAHSVSDWRRMGFHAVVADGPNDDRGASVILRMLDLKRAHPLPVHEDPGKDFTFALDRQQTCTDADHFAAYASAHPLWGMPYGMAELGDEERAALIDWVRTGAPSVPLQALSAAVEASIESWETFLNEPSLKSRLVARYLYEHLFVASLYFAGVDDKVFFRLVRSRTPQGAPVDEITTRRPFDDPGVAHPYYRLVRRDGVPLAKTHMVYPLDARRLQLYRTLFITPDYAVERLPTYEPEVAANPFRAFAAIPARSRYRFLLEEAEFTIMGFIKGPVCRGPIALGLIEDRFWVTFVDPDAPWMLDETAFLASEQPALDMPAETGSSSVTMRWHAYERAHERYMARRKQFIGERTAGGRALGLVHIWDGDGTNTNAALTVFRHFDSASVVKGLVGGPPKTAWVVDYPLLERIHYLLVAGFDVSGNLAHQIDTRVYMDFLRMEAEANFLLFVPPQRRPALVASWYRGVTGAVRRRVATELLGFGGAPHIPYRTAMPELELFDMLRARLGGVLVRRYELPRKETALAGLAAVHGVAASWMPEVSFVSVSDVDGRTYASVLRESAHTNVAHLFDESARRVKEEDALAVVPGFVGAYPNALFEVNRRDLDAFVAAVARLDSDAAYRALRQRFGVLRNSPRFWPHSDRINEANHELEPIDSGRFDFNHLEAL